MMFIVILIALLIERFFDWSHLRNWYWFEAIKEQVVQKLSAQSPYLVLGVTIIPLLFIIAIITFLLDGFLFGFIKLLFEILILVYCLGPQNLWADAFACINAVVQGDVHFAIEKLKTLFNVIEVNDAHKLHRELVGNIFIESNRRVFSVLFWFAILGPVGAVLYRTVTLFYSEALRSGDHANLSQAAYTVGSVLDWIPIRIYTFLFALGGNFMHTFSEWRQQVLLGLSSNDAMLVECGIAALGDEFNKKNLPEEGTNEKSAISLLDRVYIIVLIILAIGTLLV